MTRLINAALIGVVVAILGLGAVWAAAGGLTEPAPVTGVAIAGMKASWAAGGQALDVEFHLRNHGLTQARVESIQYAVEVDGVEYAHGESKPQTAILPQGAATSRVGASLPDGFAPSWWRGYAAAEEASTLRIHGEVVVRMPEGARTIPYTWASSWTGHLAGGLASAVSCDSASTVCASAATAAWQGGTLELQVTVSNPTQDMAYLDGADAAILLGSPQSMPIGTASSSAPAYLASGETTTLVLRFQWQDDALAAWWAGHASRCESSPAALAITLQARDSFGSQPAPFQFDAPAFQTGMVCGGSA